MLWVLLAVALVLLALVALGVVLLGVWRRVKALGRELARANAAVERASEGLAAPPDGGPRHASARPGSALSGP